MSTIDLTPTFLDEAGITYDSTWFDGRILLEVSNYSDERFVFAKQIKSAAIAVLNNKWKLTYRQGEMYLYDYHNDPQERVNLIEQYNYYGEVIALQKFLDQYIDKISTMMEGGIP